MSETPDWFEKQLQTLEGEGRLRGLRALVPESAVRVQVEGRLLRLFSSNDYLGLSSHAEVRQAAAEAAAQHGMGPRGAALVCGFTEQHRALEAELAAVKGTEAALLFPTGFQANLSVLSALGGADATIFSDQLNHASIIDGCRLARSRVQVYPHRDMEALEELLRACETRRRIIVSDSVFSMEGSLAPLNSLVALKQRYGAVLVTDEAHGTLVYGAGGGGVAQLLDVSEQIDFHVGTLSKAFGTVGGYVASSARHRTWLLNTARPFIFTTAPPLPVVAAARAALDVATRNDELRNRLWARVAQLGAALGRELQSPIVPVLIGDNRRAMLASKSLFDAGFHVPGIRPPTVPFGTARLRIALSAAHEEEDLVALVEAMKSLDLLGAAAE